MERDRPHVPAMLGLLPHSVTTRLRQLAMKVYVHLRTAHSDAVVAQVSFEQTQMIVSMHGA
jgi:hypothetical protein